MSSHSTNAGCMVIAVRPRAVAVPLHPALQSRLRANRVLIAARSRCRRTP